MKTKPPSKVKSIAPPNIKRKAPSIPNKSTVKKVNNESSIPIEVP